MMIIRIRTLDKAIFGRVEAKDIKDVRAIISTEKFLQLTNPCEDMVLAIAETDEAGNIRLKNGKWIKREQQNMVDPKMINVIPVHNMSLMSLKEYNFKTDTILEFNEADPSETNSYNETVKLGGKASSVVIPAAPGTMLPS